MSEKKQTSESVRLGIILALAGGFMDAYSYLYRGKVFANAQTGNMLLLGVNLSEGDWRAAVHYLCPVLAFIAGIALADLVRNRARRVKRLHWRQISVLLEMIILFGVSFFTQQQNLWANSLTSFACGIQVESFRKVHGNGIATTMCIGNLRSGTQNFCDYFFRKQKDSLQKGFLYYGIIFCFVLGTVLGAACVKQFQAGAIRICSAILLAAFLIMFTEYI